MMISIYNPDGLKTYDYRKIEPMQGKLKKAKDHEKLYNNIVKYGFDVPMILWFKGDTAYMLDGHQRQDVMLANDMNDHGSYEVPYVQISARDKAQAMARLLAITSQFGKITKEGLKEFIELAELDFEDTKDFISFDALPDLNFGEDTPEQNDDDEVPEADEAQPPKSEPGKIYQLGQHRLLCGDATDAEAITRLVGNEPIDMIFTDPPYNVAYVGKTKDALTIQNDKQTDGDFYQFLLDAYKAMTAVLRPGGSIYVCHADWEGMNFRKAFLDAGLLLKQCIIWNKNTMVLGRQDYQWKHEPILYGWKPGDSHYFVNERNHTTVWDVDKPSRSEDHPTMKPVELIKIAIHNSSKIGDKVLDTFGGSGSTLSAAHIMGRVCYTSELDPVYADVIRKRYAKLIGNDDWEAATPELEAVA